MTEDNWHFARMALANQVVGMFDTGLSSALIFFAPRRMGKTEFLRWDVIPCAKKHHWRAFYFSFLDVEKKPRAAFTQALLEFAESLGAMSTKTSVLSRIERVSGSVSGIKASVGLREKSDKIDLRKIFAALAKSHRVLLLLDEV